MNGCIDGRINIVMSTQFPTTDFSFQAGLNLFFIKRFIISLNIENYLLVKLFSFTQTPFQNSRTSQSLPSASVYILIFTVFYE